jgi:hypothetical protein
MVGEGCVTIETTACYKEQHGASDNFCWGAEQALSCYCFPVGLKVHTVGSAQQSHIDLCVKTEHFLRCNHAAESCRIGKKAASCIVNHTAASKALLCSL